MHLETTNFIRKWWISRNQLKITLSQISLETMNRFALLLILSVISILKSFAQEHQVLKPSNFKHYIDTFNANDNELYKQLIPNDSAWNFLQSNIPFLECPDKNIELTYYFRWWTYRKHIQKTATGHVITEFLPKVYWAEKYNTIACAASLHFYEGRWLKSNQYLKGYAKFWFSEGNPRMYSFWAANAFLEYFKTCNDSSIIKLLPDLVKNYRLWEKGWMNKGHFIGKNQDGLFSTYDDRDGMEMQISGSGKRPTINSYMYAEAIAISEFAKLYGNKQLSIEFIGKADSLKTLVNNLLWDSKAGFYKTRSEKDGQFANVRELQGYTPWYVNLAPKNKGYEKAWQLIKTNEGFKAPYGLTTAEQSHPKFEISYTGHECQWNGPVWPFATSITLKALSNLLNNYSQNIVTKDDFFTQFKTYTKSHRITLANGKVVPWIDEDLNPYTGDWISRTKLEKWENGKWSDQKGGVERGKDYNHSSYCDLLISDLIGVKPQLDNTIEINPLIPNKSWDWFCLDQVQYKGKTLTVVYDKYGTKYHQGTGLLIFVNGVLKANKPGLERISLKLE